MASRSQKRQETLEQLRENFNRTNAFSHDEDQSKDFVTLVKQEIDEIARLNHHEKVKSWGEHCRAARKKMRFSIEDVAGLIGVSHTSITNQEKINEETMVDLFYLEAFSLVYRTSPYFLIDGEEHEATKGECSKRGLPYFPIEAVDNKYQRLCNIVMNTLYVEDNSEKLAYLRALTAFAKMNTKLKNEFVAALKFFPAFEQVRQLDLANIAQADNSDLMFFMPPPIFRNQHTVEEYELRLTFWEARRSLEDLRNQCSDHLELLAQMALATEDVKDFVFTVITKGGYPKGEISMQKYNLDGLIFKDPEVKTLSGSRTRGGAF